MIRLNKSWENFHFKKQSTPLLVQIQDLKSRLHLNSMYFYTFFQKS